MCRGTSARLNFDLSNYISEEDGSVIVDAEVRGTLQLMWQGSYTLRTSEH
jgi:hypothetical protein